MKVAVFTLALVMSLAPALLAAQEDIAKHKACKFCGMDREKFATSRILIDYEDGSAEGMCSLRCAAVEMALGIDKSPKTTWVGDYATSALVDAEKAFWVVGGSVPGVMTKRAKWAFAKREDADAFVKEKGGTVVAFEAAVKAAYEDLYDDTKMIRGRRAARRNATEKK
jgi:nitrous oxide reductase accessory protein NosL